MHEWLISTIISECNPNSQPISKTSQLHLIEHLQKLIRSLPAPLWHSHWLGYQSELPYTADEAKQKHAFVMQCLTILQPKMVWDIGSNTGEFSQCAAKAGAEVIAIESDHALIEACYEKVRHLDEQILPLWMNILTPSPMLGWAHKERKSLATRSKADLLLCLAVNHHVTISGNVPFAQQAEYFASISKYLLIEFIEPTDPNAARMLYNKPELKSIYTKANFEAAFTSFFVLQKTHIVIPEQRILYLFKCR